MICNPEFASGVDTWMSYLKDLQYKRDLEMSVSVLREWLRDLPAGQFKAKLADFVPLSAVFVDPDEPDGRLFLTANVWEQAPDGRACFLLTRQDHPRKFESYWTNYQEAFARAAILEPAAQV